MTRTIVGHFVRGKEAQKALDGLQTAGFTAGEVSYVAQDTAGAANGGMSHALSDMGVPQTDGEYWSTAVAEGGLLVIVRAHDETAAQAIEALESNGAQEVREHRAVQSSGIDSSDAHADPDNYGDEGGSSQWSQTVLRVRDGESEVAKRTFSRFGKAPERLD